MGCKQYLDAFCAGAKPAPFLSVSDWADTYRYLPTTTSSEPGRYRSSRTPYLREIMDRLSAYDKTTEVVFMKGAQVGGTEAGNNWIGCVVDVSPGPMLVVQPTGDTAKKFSKLRLSSLISHTPRLQGKIKDARAKDSGNTIMQKEFPGGALLITGANSAAGLRSMPIKYLFMDEVDGYPSDVGGEGDPVLLATKRTNTFKTKKKIFKVSTPTFEGRSRIEHDYKMGTQGSYKVPCPKCKQYQVLTFEKIHYEVEVVGEETMVTNAHYECCFCKHAIQEEDKNFLLNNGVWEHKYPDRDIKSFHLSGLYSPYGWFSWKEACQEFEEAKEDIEKQVVFTNTILGETYKEKGEVPDWDRIYERSGGFPVGFCPRGVHVLTAGVDVQKNRLEIVVKGWGVKKVNWTVDHEVIEGNPADGEVWEKLREFLESTQYKHASGHTLPISMTAVDSGYMSQEVYMFARNNNKVIAIKGHDRVGPILSTPSTLDIKYKDKVVKRGILVYPFASSEAKKELYRWLAYDLPDGDLPVGYCFIPRFDKEFFKQLTAEKLVTRKTKTKFSKQEWVKLRERNEILDCSTMARAAAYKLGIDKWNKNKWEEIADAFGINENIGVLSTEKVVVKKETPKEPAKTRPRVVKSKFLSGR